MNHSLSVALAVLAALGLVALAVQLVLVVRHLARSTPRARVRPSISVLKPLCGVDDGLEENLASFAALRYPTYEVLLGLKDVHDPAFSVALAAVRRWPGRFKVVLQRGAPGHNPKVNQLATLERAARYDVLLVSDSNARVPGGYLDEIAALLEDDDVGCVTHPVAGLGEQSFGSTLDNLHMSSAVGGGMIGAKLSADQDVVVGKSMALRRRDLERLGGFVSMADVLAEDYVMGRAVRERLGMRVALARTPVRSVTVRRSVLDFWRRYSRWSVIHRTALTLPTYLAQSLLNPAPLAFLAVLAEPALKTAAFALGVGAAKIAIDLETARALGHRPGARAGLAVLVKDVILFVAWARALWVRTVEWRGHRLRVASGSRLVGAQAASPTALSAEETGASPSAVTS